MDYSKIILASRKSGQSMYMYNYNDNQLIHYINKPNQTKTRCTMCFLMKVKSRQYILKSLGIQNNYHTA